MLKTAPPGPTKQVSQDSETLAGLFRSRCEHSGPFPALYEKTPQGERWQCTTWSDFYDLSARAAAGLLACGLELGARVAILGGTRIAWAVYDMAAQLAGLVSFGIYPRQTAPQVRYLLQHSEAEAIFVENREELETVLEAATQAPALRTIIPWTGELYVEFKDRDPRIIDPERFAEDRITAEDVATRGESRAPDDTAILIYTSGTTGPPKAAMISHRNILSLLRSWNSICAFDRSDISLSFLPMAHAAERVLSFYGRLDTGIATAFATRIATVLDELSEVSPTLFGSVPRLYEKAYAQIYSDIRRKPPVSQRIFRWAIALGRTRVRQELAGRALSPSQQLQLKAADRLVFRRIRAAFGGRVRQMVTGAAPIDREILEFFWAVGLPIYECYGADRGDRRHPHQPQRRCAADLRRPAAAGPRVQDRRGRRGAHPRRVGLSRLLQGSRGDAGGLRRRLAADRRYRRDRPRRLPLHQGP